MRQILINLVGNAMKFTEQGTIFIELVTAKKSNNEVVLSFSVKDTGIGIAVEKKPQLFQAFRQVDGSMTRAKGGTGLGLAISRQLTELMGGTIGVDSELAGFPLPFHSPLQKLQREDRAPAPVPGAKLRLLVAEHFRSRPRAVVPLKSRGLEPVFTRTVERAAPGKARRKGATFRCCHHRSQGSRRNRRGAGPADVRQAAQK